jgi:hypothetical protein
MCFYATVSEIKDNRSKRKNAEVKRMEKKTEEQVAEKPKKRSIWQRLFGKKKKE